jgi:phage shock protein E
MSKKLNKSNAIYLIIFIVLLGLFSGCSTKNVENNKQIPNESKEASFRNITPEEAKNKLDSEKGILVLDVRTEAEYATGHIKDSILIPVDVIKDKAEETLKDKDATIFVYCRSGNRSATAANILIDLGYKNVYNLGGINDWTYEIVK